jgi:hypothetical protein
MPKEIGVCARWKQFVLASARLRFWFAGLPRTHGYRYATVRIAVYRVTFWLHGGVWLRGSRALPYRGSCCCGDGAAAGNWFMEAPKNCVWGYNKFFSGTIPTELSQVYNVRIISLDHNAFTGSVPDLNSTGKLETLASTTTRVGRQVSIRLFAKLSGLKRIGLQNNKLSNFLRSGVDALH